MSTTKTNALVAQYRKLALQRAKLELAWTELELQTHGLTNAEMADYIEKTDAITEAIESLLDDAAVLGWKTSTTATRVSAAANAAGRDTADRYIRDRGRV